MGTMVLCSDAEHTHTAHNNKRLASNLSYQFAHYDTIQYEVLTYYFYTHTAVLHTVILLEIPTKKNAAKCIGIPTEKKHALVS